jgi:uncharacterized protein
MPMKNRLPDLAIVVTVEEAFIHCAKCVIRSNLWDEANWPDATGLASIAQVMLDHGRSTDSLAQMEAQVAESYRDRLY